jgi:alpha-L-rhamnosidase
MGIVRRRKAASAPCIDADLRRGGQARRLNAVALLLCGIIVWIPTPCWAGINVERLRCEYLTNPLGIDAAKPRLSWILQSAERGQRQTAYQVLVASTPDVLAKDQGDLWDSGRVASDQSVHVEYAGTPLGSRMRCCWKVRAWDKDGRPSTWSQPAFWTMGLLQPSDWQGKWIAATPPPTVATPHNGYHSALIVHAPDAVKWVAVDLGHEQTIDAVRLHPSHPYDRPSRAGYMFPVRFKIEAAGRADFSDAKIVVDRTAADVPNPGADAPLYRFAPLRARYVRLTVTRLAQYDDARWGFTLAEMEVLAGTQNVALRAAVTALDALEQGGWSKNRLVDGRVLGERGQGDASSSSATMLRREFDLRGPVKRATASVTGLGLYELRLNGQRVGDQLLAPGYTVYPKRIQYQTCDVTGLLREGQNAVGAQLGGGWWTGPLPFDYARPGYRLCLLMRLDIELADGTMQTIVTDPSWQSTIDGPIRAAGIYFGETYDATREMPGWDQPGFASAGWRPVLVLPYPDGAEKAALVAQPSEPIRVTEELQPVKITEPKPGVYVFDMGQNMVGWCRLTTDAPAGTKITLRHAEVLNEDGTIYTANLRSAAQVAEYTTRGGKAVVEPHFTHYGFRYVEVSGLPHRPDKDALVGRVFHAANSVTGRFACSSALVNQIMHCVDWVQRGNMLSVPTDCPQRDERLGWMGDAQAFSQTAMFGRDMAGFYTKWVRDVRDSQADNGRYTDMSPAPNASVAGTPAWGDAGTIVPWHTYQSYADKRLLAEHFESARRWVDFIRSSNADSLWRNGRGNDYNDWLNGDETVLEGYPRGISAIPKEIFATAFFAHSTEIVAQMAAVLGRADDSNKYAKLFSDIKAAFNKAYVSPDGRIKGDTQAGYALALHFNLLDESLRPKATAHLIEAIHRYKDHPSTGIQTSHHMMLALSDNGRHDEAWRLISLRTVPSWGHMIDMGATTIWERWDGYVKGRGFQSPVMNSFNHPAFGAVGEWVWRELAGINPDEQQPGYKHFLLRPRPVGDLAWVKARYDSIRGPITSDWRMADGRFQLHVEIPANTTATVVVPTSAPGSVTEGGKPAGASPGVGLVKTVDGTAAMFRVESGRYDFSAPALELRPNPSH